MTGEMTGSGAAAMSISSEIVKLLTGKSAIAVGYL